MTDPRLLSPEELREISEEHAECHGCSSYVHDLLSHIAALEEENERDWRRIEDALGVMGNADELAQAIEQLRALSTTEPKAEESDPSEDIAAGRATVYESTEEFLAALGEPDREHH